MSKLVEFGEFTLITGLHKGMPSYKPIKNTIVPITKNLTVNFKLYRTPRRGIVEENLGRVSRVNTRGDLYVTSQLWNGKGEIKSGSLYPLVPKRKNYKSDLTTYLIIEKNSIINQT